MRFAWVSLLASVAVSAQTTGQTLPVHDAGPIVLELQGSTRALSLGGAYPVNSADPEAIFYNPALLQTARGLAISMQRFGRASTLSTFSVATDAGFGFGLQILDYAPEVQTPIVEDIGSPFGLSELGTNNSGEVAATIGYTRMFFGKVRLGAAGKWAQHWGNLHSRGVAAFDIGTTVNPIAWLSVSAAVQNLGGHFDIAETSYDLPRRYTINVATRPRIAGPLDLMWAGRVGLDHNEDVDGSLGMEVGYWPFSGLNFYGRGGIKLGELGASEWRTRPTIKESRGTAGFGVSWGRQSLDYAWEPFQNADDAHRIGIRIR